MMTLLLAGHETTAMALTWALAAIDQAPAVRADLEAEWDARPEVVPAGRLPDALPLTTAVLAETLRLWPPSWMFSRRVLEPVVLGGRTLQAGTMCLISPALLHRDPRWWAEPEQFRPDRWLRREPGRPTASIPSVQANHAAPICPSVLDPGCASGSSLLGQRPQQCWPSWAAAGASASTTHR